MPTLPSFPVLTRQLGTWLSNFLFVIFFAQADVEGGRVSYDAEAHTVVVDRGAQGARVTVKVFEAVKVHISVQTAKADGKPSLKVLMTQPPLGDQPSEDPSALTGAVISKRKGREGEGGSGAEKKQKDKK